MVNSRTPRTRSSWTSASSCWVTGTRRATGSDSKTQSWLMWGSSKRSPTSFLTLSWRNSFTIREYHKQLKKNSMTFSDLVSRTITWVKMTSRVLLSQRSRLITWKLQAITSTSRTASPSSSAIHLSKPSHRVHSTPRRLKNQTITSVTSISTGAVYSSSSSQVDLRKLMTTRDVQHLWSRLLVKNSSLSWTSIQMSFLTLERFHRPELSS